MMNKYGKLFNYVNLSGEAKLTLSFDRIAKIAGVPIDHSFLTYKKELIGYDVKISIKNKEAVFIKR